jgi:nucleoside-diphosphate-sugar epimerase
MISEKKIVVTGAGGLIGNALCNLLFENQLPFIALYRSKSTEVSEWHKEYCNLENSDIINLKIWQNTSCIIHCAAAIPSDSLSVESCYEINKQIDQNIYKAIFNNSVPKLIFISTSSVYSFSAKEINEDSDVSPQSVYSKGKLESESIFRSLRNCETVFLRINAPYHFKQKSRTVLKIFIEDAINDKQLIYHGNGLRQQDFTAVEDIVKAIFQIIIKGIKTSGEVYILSSGKPISMVDLAQMIISLLPDCKSKIGSSGMIDAQEDVKSIFSIKKFYRDYNWRPELSLDQGVKNWIASIKK